MTKFITLNCETYEGVHYTTVLNVADISVVKDRPNGTPGCVVERMSAPQHAVWALDSVRHVKTLLKQACDVVK